MADNTLAVSGVNSATNTQPVVSEKDFAQIRTVEKPKSEGQPPKSTDKEEGKQQPLFAPGTVTEETVSQITEAVNDYMKQNDCNLELNYNKEANMINVKVIDKESGEVIREFPSEEMIERMIKAEESAENNQMRGIFVNRMV